MMLRLKGGSCLATNRVNLHIKAGLCNSKVAVTLVKGRRRSAVEMSTRKIDEMGVSMRRSACYRGKKLDSVWVLFIWFKIEKMT